MNKSILYLVLVLIISVYSCTKPEGKITRPEGKWQEKTLTGHYFEYEVYEMLLLMCDNTFQARMYHETDAADPFSDSCRQFTWREYAGTYSDITRDIHRFQLCSYYEGLLPDGGISKNIRL